MRGQPSPSGRRRRLEVDHPGQSVQLDCSASAGFRAPRGTVWQYSAIDVASASTCATLQVLRRNPSVTWTSQLARQIAADLASRGWKLERVMNDNASEFRSATFQSRQSTTNPRGGGTCRNVWSRHPGRCGKIPPSNGHL